MSFFIFIVIGFAGNFIGTLSGGGGLITLPTMLLYGLPVHSAIGANKVANTVSSLTSFLVIFKEKGVTLKEALSVLVTCLVGGAVGGIIASFMSGDSLTLIAIVLLTFAFVTSFLRKGNFVGEKMFKLNTKTGSILFGIGMYDGMFGPGSGTLQMYLYASQKVAYIRAVGLSRVGVFAGCFGSAITYISTGKIVWSLTIALMVGGIIGAQVGIKVARKMNVKYVNPLLRGITLLLIVQIIMSYYK
ncbi:sulfite exporter TauE/SafE family protein [Viridibacillus sp. YIM B01967]|uniref:Probable membrane transporter protein n=1 Tax=Viridibacillus soli TaxID=2798301 RepID=A0ABS1H926_9BACL|nr:sulfite exporter TauE/SafE family protein [Viridibacillus soli]MBK3495916.1 sulfite exporter TauE/SafE family protein [Viridibacillus soli]